MEENVELLTKEQQIQGEITVIEGEPEMKNHKKIPVCKPRWSQKENLKHSPMIIV